MGGGRRLINAISYQVRRGATNLYGGITSEGIDEFLFICNETANFLLYRLAVLSPTEKEHRWLLGPGYVDEVKILEGMSNKRFD